MTDEPDENRKTRKEITAMGIGIGELTLLMFLLGTIYFAVKRIKAKR
jgi:hypothetical protein